MNIIKPNLLLASLTISAISFTNPIWQAQSHNNNLTINKLAKAITPDILDFNNTMQKAILIAYKFNNPAKATKISDEVSDFKIINLTKSNIKATTIGEPVLDYNNILFNYIGHSVLKNNTDQAQTITSIGFKHINKEIVSTTIAYGISLTIDVTIKIFNIDTKFVFNTSTTYQTENTNEIIIPPIAEVVPPHKKLIVDMYLNQLQVTQKVALDVDINGKIGATMHFLDGKTAHYENSIANLIFYLQLAGQCPSQITVNGNDTIHFNGLAARSKSSAGNDYTVQVNGPFDI